MATVLLAPPGRRAGRLAFTSAGHLPPLVVHADGRAEFLAGGTAPPLLAYGDGEPAVAAALEPGARMVLYTDGLVERRRGADRRRAGAAAARPPTASRARVDALCDHLLDAMRPPPGLRGTTTSRSIAVSHAAER